MGQPNVCREAESQEVTAVDEAMLEFVRKNQTAFMVTTRKNGTAHAARMNVTPVDGKLWSSGTKTRVRTKHLLQNPVATLAIFEEGTGRWLGVEARVTMYEGQDSQEKHLAMHKARGDAPADMAAFNKRLEDEQRIIYEFEPVRTYGRYS
jgi:hypothetical protein